MCPDTAPLKCAHAPSSSTVPRHLLVLKCAQTLPSSTVPKHLALISTTVNCTATTPTAAGTWHPPCRVPWKALNDTLPEIPQDPRSPTSRAPFTAPFTAPSTACYPVAFTTPPTQRPLRHPSQRYPGWYLERCTAPQGPQMHPEDFKRCQRAPTPLKDPKCTQRTLNAVREPQRPEEGFKCSREAQLPTSPTFPEYPMFPTFPEYPTSPKSPRALGAPAWPAHAPLHGLHMRPAGEYDGAMTQYLQTLRVLEPSYVIRR
eukprot:354883-Chlamydomonas_euryale.AAC.3